MDRGMNSVRWLLAFVAAVALAVTALSSCGAGDRPVQRDTKYYERLVVPIYTERFYPYVESIEFRGERVPGEIITAYVTIMLPDDIPEALYYLNTTTDPISQWIDEYTYFDVLLKKSHEEATGHPGYRKYNGLGELILRVLVPPPGQYEIRYWSAVSPEVAGEYARELAREKAELELRSLIFEVPEDT